MSKTKSNEEELAKNIRRITENPLLVEFMDGTKAVTTFGEMLNEPRFYEGSYKNIKNVSVLDDPASKVLYAKNKRSSSK